jgi:peptidoglycan hydrolase CwlO-like protein
MSLDEKSQLSWHTLWTIMAICIGFASIAVQIFFQFELTRQANDDHYTAMATRVVKIETEMDVLDKHIENIQYQLDHERGTK